MGFKCPKCKKDFGYDRESFEKHYNECTGISVEKARSVVMENSVELTKDIAIDSIIDLIKD